MWEKAVHGSSRRQKKVCWPSKCSSAVRLCRSQKFPHWTSLWPRSIPPDDAYLAYFPTPVKSGPDAPCKRPAPAFEVIAAEGNGACLFRCFSMPLQARAGVPAKAIVDGTESAMKLRDEILRHMELSLQWMDANSMAFLQEQVCMEMWDDPGWMEGPGKAAWNWKNGPIYASSESIRDSSSHWCVQRLKGDRSCHLRKWQKKWQRTTATTQSCCRKPACTMTCCFCAAWDARRAIECRQMKGKRHCSMGIKDHERLAAPLPPTHWWGPETEDGTISLYIYILNK